MLKLLDHQIERLHRWAMASCAMHATFRSDRDTVVIVRLRDTRRSTTTNKRGDTKARSTFPRQRRAGGGKTTTTKA